MTSHKHSSPRQQLDGPSASFSMSSFLCDQSSPQHLKGNGGGGGAEQLRWSRRIGSLSWQNTVTERGPSHSSRTYPKTPLLPARQMDSLKIMSSGGSPSGRGVEKQAWGLRSESPPSRKFYPSNRSELGFCCSHRDQRVPSPSTL